MPESEFESIREQLQQGRQQLEQAQQALFLAREKLKQVEAEQAQLARHFDEDNPQDVAHRQRLAAVKAESEAAIERLTAVHGRHQEMLGGQLGAFLELSDPRRLVTRLDDTYPFLLLPLRLETRFKQLSSTQHQLWVRVYPDDCAIDSFEAALSETEVRNARRYWSEAWRAGGVEADERGAWRGLVGSHGSGRALWIVQQYRPLNVEAKPEKGEAIDVILVITTEQPLPAAEEVAAVTFWEAVWRAGDDAAAIAAAQAALAAAVGTARAQVIAEEYRPFNLDDEPPASVTRADAAVTVTTVIFPGADDVPTKRHAWSQPATVPVMPERLVLLGYTGGEKVVEALGALIPSPLVVGPDPSAPTAEQIRPEGDEIAVGAEMKWMVDFDEAIAKGMAFKIDLNPEQARRGFDRLLVLGLRLSSDQHDGQARLETLIRHHHYSRTGFSLLPQGTATNNTEEAGAGFAGGDDADASFDIMVQNQPLFELTTDWMARRDGQWLAEWLGIDPAVLQRVPHAGGTDQIEARAMNVALWPATLGYWMDTMMAPVFDDSVVNVTRQFFVQLVSGRGMVPAVRIGKQPYGILPTTVISRMQWEFGRLEAGGLAMAHVGGATFLARLHEVLLRAYTTWSELLPKVAHVGKAGDPHQILLDVLGLHPTSVEYYKRYAESLEQLFNRLNLGGLGGLFLEAIIAAGLLDAGMDILRDNGYSGDEPPAILENFFFSTPQRLRGPLIDDRPLSEGDPVRAYTTDGRNYIRWLADAARLSLETIRKQEGFIDDKPPLALLYLMLRHAITLGYHDAGLRLYQRAEVLDGEALRLARAEPNFVHVVERAESSESRWRLLYDTVPRVTDGRDDIVVAEYIPMVLDEFGETDHLREQIEALELLQDVPTARLERVFAEHIDTCSYRLDAWLLGLVQYKLALLRFSGQQDTANGEHGSRRGLYLGAYGWLENVRPENKHLTPVRLDGELDQIFNKEGEAPLLRDSANAGYVHTPSPNHAVTAAVLRNGYLSNAASDQPDLFAVNLSSERVRRAMGILEGIRNEQSLAALLGYHFERGLHDRHNQAEVDVFIYHLRKVFPLRADHLESTRTDANVPIEAVEARNVIDGLALVNHIQESGEEAYPFGKADLPLPDAADPDGPAKLAAINAEVRRLLDSHDAVADLALAEGVHQAVQGNYDRAAATLDSYSQGHFPPLPDVVQTPRSGIALTHRVGLHLEPGLDVAGMPAITPRAIAEPALNQWLAAVLPEPDDVACLVTYEDIDGTEIEAVITQADLGLQPLDLLFLLNPESQQAMTGLDDRLIRYTTETFSPRPDKAITIHYTERPNGSISFFELGAPVKSLRSLLLRSRPSTAFDLALPNEARPEDERAASFHESRLTHVRDQLVVHLDDLRTLASDLQTLLADPAANQSAIVSDIDDHLDRFLDLLAAVNLYGLPQSGYGFALAWKRSRYATLIEQVAGLVERWQACLDRFDAIMADYNGLPAGASDAERFGLLQQAEAKVSATLTTPIPATPAAYEAIVLGKQTDFANKRGQLAAILETTATGLATLVAAIENELPIDHFDAAAIDLDGELEEIVRYTGDMERAISHLVNDLDVRLATVNDDLATFNSTAAAQAKTDAFSHAVATLLGEDFRVVPEFTLAPAQADEFDKAYNAQNNLLDHLINTVQTPFPVDDWLYGMARVREKMRQWENVTVLAGTLGRGEPELQPLQLPFAANDHWLALAFPDDYAIDSDRLLYTAHFAVPYDKSAPQCGLLLDEWTEVIPAAEETTGVTFHYDRPNTEPPQVMLLVTPPQFKGQWQWDDLVDTLHETLELAKRRAVEPDHVDTTTHARYLPATISAVTMHPITISLNLALNNEVFTLITEEEDENG